jgi:hypothetical protein
MKIHTTKALIAGVLLTLSAHSQASLIKFTSPVGSPSSALTGTFTLDTELNTYSNVNLSYDLANGNVQTIEALTSNGSNSASTISLNFIGSRPVLLQNTDFTLTFASLGGLDALSLITWSSITDILTFGTQRKIFGFQESGESTFTVAELLSTKPPSQAPLPSSIAMFASGLVGFAGYRRRQKNKFDFPSQQRASLLPSLR